MMTPAISRTDHMDTSASYQKKKFVMLLLQRQMQLVLWYAISMQQSQNTNVIIYLLNK